MTPTLVLPIAAAPATWTAGTQPATEHVLEVVGDVRVVLLEEVC
jgi:hypothetical protein